MRRLASAAILLAASTAFAGTPGNPNGVVTTSNVTIGLQPVFSTDTSGAVQMATAPGDPTGLYVATVGGKIYRYDRAAPASPATLFLDLGAASAAAFSGGPSIGTEFQAARAASGADGMFGIAFAPGFNNPNDPGFHKFYTFADEKYASYSGTNTTFLPPEVTPNHANVVREWTASGSGSALTVSTSQAARTVISIGNPGHHNAGDPKFGPDGFLYFTTGDGGGNGDGFSGSITNGSDGFTGSSTVAAVSNGQDLSNALGKVMRIDPFVKTAGGTTIVSKTNEVLSGNGGYFIPSGPTAGSGAGNPFVGQTYTIPGKSAPALGEIYAYGLRNPWKFSFDTTGKLLLSNVGQHQMESILQISNGTNAAWPFYEGSVTGDQFTARTTQAQGLGSFTPPVKPLTGSAGTVLTSYPTRWVSNSGNSLQTWTGDGSAAVGGLVYHGSAIPQLDGMYIFGDLQFVGGTGTYTAGTNSVNGGTMTENDSRFFFLNPDDPADLTATVYAGNASTGASSLVDVGVQTYLLNFAAGMGPPNITANGANPALLYGFGQDQNGEFYALFDDGSVYQIVAVPEAGTLATLLSGVVLLLRRGKRNRTPVHAR